MAGEIEDSVGQPIWSAKSCFSFHHIKKEVQLKTSCGILNDWDGMSKLIISDEDLLTLVFSKLDDSLIGGHLSLKQIHAGFH